MFGIKDYAHCIRSRPKESAKGTVVLGKNSVMKVLPSWNLVGLRKPQKKGIVFRADHSIIML